MTASVPRSNVSQQINFLRRHVDASIPTPNMATGILFPNGLPAGAVITNVVVSNPVAFAAGAVLTVGTTPGGNNIANAADTAAGALGSHPCVAWQTGAQPAATADQDVYVTVTGAPATGVADVVISYAPNIDG